MNAEAYPQEVLAEEEPRYLRRQKPLEIKRRKFGRKAWKTYLRVSVWVAGGVACAWIAFSAGHFLLTSPQMTLVHPDQIVIAGNHYVPPASVREIFKADRGRGVLRIPLDARRQEIESLDWVEQAIVRRALPNRIEVEITERTPIAYLRQGSDLALIDAHGMILDKPLEGDFNFPVVTGIGPAMPQDERQRRMQLFAAFARQVEAARPGAFEQVSEVDLSDANDLRATITGLQGNSSAGTGAAPVLVHFGDDNFESKYRSLLDGIEQWRATAGPVRSVDLRFNSEAVVNSETSATLAVNATHAQVAENLPAARAAKKTAGRRAP
ncbi:MAG: cell division protein FtsQ/DivIB [Candidatus Acidiferrales bacterium]